MSAKLNQAQQQQRRPAVFARACLRPWRSS